MTERPIIFNGDMVRAILSGQKTQTRRPVRPPFEIHRLNGSNGTNGFLAHPDGYGGRFEPYPCPFGQPGDRLWVRETWRLADPEGEDALSEDVYGPYAPFIGSNGSRKIRWRVIYQATSSENHPKYGKALWTPSIHMPRWASRLILELTDINVERVQDITEDEAINEGVVDPIMGTYGMNPITIFRDLWDALYAKRPGLLWQENPWVWAISFRRVEQSNAQS